MKNRYGKRMLRLAALLLFCGSIWQTTAASAPPRARLYGITFFGNQLIEVNPTNGTSHVVSDLSAPISAFGIAARYGQLYSFDATTDEVIQIDPATGKVVQSIDVGMPDVQGEGDLAFRSDGILFLSVAFDAPLVPSNKVFAIDVVNRTSRLVGNCHFPYDGFAFDTNDVLYAVAQGQGKLYRIDQSNGMGAEIGSLGIPMNSPFAGLSFGADGKLYGAIDDRLFQINTNSAAATPVDSTIIDLGFSSVSGLTLDHSAPSESLVGLSFFSGQLVRIDDTTGAGTLVGTNQSKANGVGLASLAGRLYTFDANTDRIYEIDPGSGMIVSTNDIHIPDVQGEGDIAFNRDGKGYLTTALDANLAPAPRLYTFDITNGTSQLIGSTGVAVDALAFDDMGTLYALGQGGTMLYRANTNTGALTPVGGLGVLMNSPFAALTFTPEVGLIAAIDDRLYTVNEMTGAATPIDPDVLDIGFSSISGLALAATRVLGISREGSRVVIFWNDSDSNLQSSSNVEGPYTDTASQATPQSINPTGGNRFFRLRHL